MLELAKTTYMFFNITENIIIFSLLKIQSFKYMCINPDNFPLFLSTSTDIEIHKNIEHHI